jgi:multiple sugar transport system substrate-binding protein
MKHKYLVLMCVLCILLLATSCGTTGPKSQPESKPTPSESVSESEGASKDAKTMTFPTENVTVNFIWWGNQVRNERTQKIVDMFMEEHPNVKFETEYIPGATYQDKLLTMVASNQTPDIFQNEYEYIPQYIKAGALQSFEPYIEAGIIDISDCIALDACRYNGDLYAHNLGLNGPSIMYDIKLLEELGIEVDPTKPWTWEDFLNVGREVFNKTGIRTSFKITFNMTEWLRCSARNEGQQLFLTSTELGITDTDIIKRSYEIIETAYKEGFIVPGEFYANYQSVEQQAVVTGDAWNACLTSNMVIGLQNAVGPDRPIGLMMIPDFPGSKETGQFVKPSQVMCMSATSSDAQKIVAATFIDWMVSSIEANEVLLGERGAPSNMKVSEAISGLVDDAPRRMFEFVNTAGKFAGSLDVADASWMQEAYTYAEYFQDAVVFGQYTAQQATDDFMKKLDELINEAKSRN